MILIKILVEFYLTSFFYFEKSYFLQVNQLLLLKLLLIAIFLRTLYDVSMIGKSLKRVETEKERYGL